MRGLQGMVLGVAVAALVAGCNEEKKPMTIDAPNEVIFKVPSMT